MATIELAEKFLPYVDEMFSKESKLSLLTNKDFTFDGAKTVHVYKIGTGAMSDYGRSGAADGNWSRYGHVETLDATTEAFTMKKDRSFTFVIDRLDADETAQQLSAATALARQQREVVIPEIDSYVYSVMCERAGISPEAAELNADNIYSKILEGSEAMDDAMVPDTQRVLVVTPAVYTMMKLSEQIVMNTEIGADMRLKGVIANLDGLTVIRVPASRLPVNFGFMIAHPCATVAPVKLEDYRTHDNPPGISGQLCEGRFVYDAFVLENKAKAIYYQSITA